MHERYFNPGPRTGATIKTHAPDVAVEPLIRATPYEFKDPASIPPRNGPEPEPFDDDAVIIAPIRTELGRACELAEGGVRVVPVDRKTGRPLVMAEDATTDLDVIRKWWREFDRPIAVAVAIVEDNRTRYWTQSQASLISAKQFTLRDPSMIPKREWLYGNHLIRKFGSATIALGGVGKSSLETVEALALATQRSLLGITPRQRCRVWYWGEDPIEELERRFAAACIHYNISNEDIEGYLFVNSGRDCKIVIATQTRNGATIAEPVVDGLLATIRHHSIDVVIIDPFIKSHRVPENDNGAMDAVAETWIGIADAANIALELSHHSRKAGGAEVTVEHGRGAIALINACRSARALNSMTPEEAAKCGIEYRKGEYFRADDGKANMVLPAEKAIWYRLQSVALPNSPLGPSFPGGDWIGVATRWKRPDLTADVTATDFERVAAFIRIGNWRADPRPRTGSAMRWSRACPGSRSRPTRPRSKP
ncbi:AAA family ATPase [Bradyrhizobium sp. CCBAU 45384]|uniref:AAA family ATPase n=1 Tax=Bradyrhizobium sp. CCBAU 45384 TaxID=858428 RepID=UPI002306CACC|nr:AAA family ATPase [Bradyrhizobium sp. CCBAU 45384]